MIKIKRCECPEVLADTPQEGIHYNKQPVVEALHKMQNKKCCYCEQILPEGGQGKAVEHFHPRSIYKHKINDWKNLLLACDQCNGNKSSKFPVYLPNKDGELVVIDNPTTTDGEPIMIDPSDDSLDPEDHITFLVEDREDDILWGLACEKNKSQRGRKTIDVIELYKKYYLEKHQIFLDKLFDLYTALRTAHIIIGNDQKKQIYKDKLEMVMGAPNEFSALARAFARYKRLEKYGVKIPAGYE